MGTKLILCSLLFFIFGGCLYAAPPPILPGFELNNKLGTEHEPIEITSPVPTITQFSNKRLNVERELKNIAEVCIAPTEYEEIYGNSVKFIIANMIATFAFKASNSEIGLAELRKALKFSPLPPWKESNSDTFGAGWLPEVPIQGPVITLEDYYKTQEPRYQDGLSNMHLFEHNAKDTINYFDKRFPSIRKIYKQEFERLAPASNALDRKAINEMISSYRVLNERIEKALDGARELKFGKCFSKKALEMSEKSSAAYSEYYNMVTATTSPPPSELDVKLYKISLTCFKKSDYENMTDYTAKNYFSRYTSLPRDFLTMMGLQELRDVLKFSPLPAWTKYNETEPSDKELDSAPTLEAYYNLQEPKSKARSIDNGDANESTYDEMIQLLDEKFPEIRGIYRSEMERVRMSLPPVLDKETIDIMLNEFGNIDYKAYKAVNQMKDGYNQEC